MIYLIIAGSSVVICTLVSLFAIKTLHWLNGWKYWLATVGILPIALVIAGLWMLLSFEPPSITYRDAPLHPDPGPLNFAVAAFIGAITPVIYLVVAVPTAFILRRLLQP